MLFGFLHGLTVRGFSKIHCYKSPPFPAIQDTPTNGREVHQSALGTSGWFSTERGQLSSPTSELFQKIGAPSQFPHPYIYIYIKPTAQNESLLEGNPSREVGRTQMIWNFLSLPHTQHELRSKPVCSIVPIGSYGSSSWLPIIPAYITGWYNPESRVTVQQISWVLITAHMELPFWKGQFIGSLFSKRMLQLVVSVYIGKCLMSQKSTQKMSLCDGLGSLPSS